MRQATRSADGSRRARPGSAARPRRPRGPNYGRRRLLAVLLVVAAVAVVVILVAGAFGARDRGRTCR